MSTVEKQQFHNESGGYLGVVVIGPKGAETGVAVEPDGYVWLSREEQVLTANAPRRPEDNPFLERTDKYIDQLTGEEKERTYTPLVPSSNARFVPSEGRYIPETTNDVQATAHAQQAATASEPTTVLPERRDVETQHQARSLEGTAALPGTPTPKAPSRAAAAAQAAQERPEAPDEPQAPPQAPQTSQEEPVQDEETAAAVDPSIGEETGAAVPPTTPAPEGEYQAGEEVGTPTAPSHPAPYTPPSE
jgi:hypothetical protein